MNAVDRYLAYMKFKSIFKKIPVLSSTIRYVKWKWYRPYIIKKWTKKREMIYNKKLLGLIPWSSNEEKLLQLKGKYNGKIAFIIGNGPSLRMEDLETLKNNHIFCFASNRINLVFDKTSWRPDCYMAIDPLIYRDGDPTIPIVLAEKLKYYIFAEDTYKGIPSNYRSDNVLYFLNQPNSYYVPIHEFSNDSLKYVVGGFTVTYAALQMAYYMGFSKVYLLGVDCNYSKSLKRNGKVVIDKNNSTTYFDKRYDPKAKNVGYIDGMLEGYLTAQRFCLSEKEFKIFNASRGDNLKIFPFEKFEDIIIRNQYTS